MLLGWFFADNLHILLGNGSSVPRDFRLVLSESGMVNNIRNYVRAVL